MAGIGASIELTDRMTGTLNRINASLYSTISALGSADEALNSAFDPSCIQTISQEMYGYEQRIHQLENDLIGANKRIEQMRDDTEQARSSANGLESAWGKVATAIAAYATINTVENIVETSDELVQTRARVDGVNDGLQTTDELMNKIYQSAQNARGNYLDMASVVAKLGSNARESFSSSGEIVRFGELVQKQFTIAGASTTEASNAMLQLTQGLGSGVLRGDELNSVFENAPNLIRNIADYLDVGVGKIRDLAGDGMITADIVKNAIFAAADDIDKKFEEMPMTWGQVVQSIQNKAIVMFQPLLNKINEIANSDGFNAMLDGVMNGLYLVAEIAVSVFDFMCSGIGFVSENWSLFGPIIYGICAALLVYAGYLAIVKGIEIASAAATVISTSAKLLGAAAMVIFTGATWAGATAQLGLNAALYACPLVWILILIIAVIAAIYLIIAAINKVTGSTISATGVIMGVLFMAAALVYNTVAGVVNGIWGIIATLYNFIANIVNAIATGFQGGWDSILAGAIQLAMSVVNVILDMAQSIGSIIDAIFGTTVSSSIQGFQDKANEWANSLTDGTEKVEVMKTIDDTNVLDRWEYSDAWNSGYSVGEDVESGIGDLFSGGSGLDDLATGGLGDYGSSAAPKLDNIDKNTSDIKDSVDISKENLKYLRDIAEQETVNRFTTAEIKVDMTNNNNVANDTDIDGMVSNLSEGVRQAMEEAAKGTHK